ncbi:MAG: bifunctional 2-C-methyl-D-erythritol 4-phosphate cytidylyltransferase/2-C-methyl-D-erythritol 2,4-cyclodiphosphate synthase [Sphingobium sp.]
MNRAIGKTAAIIVAAGNGSRVGGGIPKQYQMLGGKSVLAHSFDTLTAHASIDMVVVVIGAGQREQAVAALPHSADDLVLVEGGATRQLSVRNGLEYLAHVGGVDRVLVHDAARPNLPGAVIDRLLAGLNEHEGAIPTLAVVDTLARGSSDVLGERVERDGLYHVQTPQAFMFHPLLAAHGAWPMDQTATDDAGMFRAAGFEVALVAGDRRLDKITHAEDFARAERTFARTSLTPRVGMGYDVHRLVKDKDLCLCGIKIPHDSGLSGHSDADVALHALVDAILGALGDGDIGSHFPPSDPQWAGASSDRFLSFARDRVAARGGRIGNVDVTIICEAPKVAPHRDAMRQSIASLLRIEIERVSVKATTTEGLGMTGRHEGIAAHAIATVQLPDL